MAAVMLPSQVRMPGIDMPMVMTAVGLLLILTNLPNTADVLASKTFHHQMQSRPEMPQYWTDPPVTTTMRDDRQGSTVQALVNAQSALNIAEQAAHPGVRNVAAHVS